MEQSLSELIQTLPLLEMLLGSRSDSYIDHVPQRQSATMTTASKVHACKVVPLQGEKKKEEKKKPPTETVTATSTTVACHK